MEEEISKLRKENKILRLFLVLFVVITILSVGIVLKPKGQYIREDYNELPTNTWYFGIFSKNDTTRTNRSNVTEYCQALESQNSSFIVLSSVQGYIEPRSERLLYGYSMFPTIIPGQTYLTVKAEPNLLKEGQIVVVKIYNSNTGQLERVVHRIIKIDTETGLITTKGDNNINADISVNVAQIEEIVVGVLFGES